MIIPEISVTEAVTQPSKTWRLDLAAGRIQGGMIDGNAAVAQAAQLALLTERFAHVIYSWAYGSELNILVGMEPAYIRAEAPRMIREALLQDDRILGVSNFSISGAAISFEISTAFGRQTIITEVPGI